MIVCTLFAELRRRDTRAGTTTNVPIVLNKQNTLYLNHATAKKCLPRIRKFNPAKKYLDHPRHLKSGVPPGEVF